MSTLEEQLRETIRAIVREELAKATPANDGAPLTVAEYAAHWKVSQSTVRAALRENRLTAIRIGRSVRVSATERIAPAANDKATERAMLRLLGGTSR